MADQSVHELLSARAGQCPGYTITIESFPGRKDRYVTRAITASARPYLIVTADLDELRTELCGPARVPALPRRVPGTSWTPDVPAR